MNLRNRALGLFHAVAVRLPPLRKHAFGASDPRRYGAYGNGRHDDTAAFREAARAGKGHIRCGKGRYLVKGQIVCDVIEGIGPGSTEIVWGGDRYPRSGVCGVCVSMPSSYPEVEEVLIAVERALSGRDR